ncbi:MAG TPA: protein phosphatase 2C domain-containing protein [Candidatus Bathyarchaeia archaeon]|nr:protein phosphatase 2C domain-containing protein [Candidatus Bathyarchaeia archaeon]
MKIDACSATDIGLVRKSNQDAVGCFPELSVFVLADGMGGLESGEVASRLAVDAVERYFAEGSSGGGSETDPLRSAVELANRDVLQERNRRTGPEGPPTIGTTIVLLQLLPQANRAAWAHVGDSRLYRVRDQQLILLTADHTLSGAAFRNLPSVPLDLPHTNVLVQALGIGPDVEIAIASDALQPGDLFLLCSDGISGLVDPASIERELLAETSLEDKARRLIDLALAASGKDNASCVLVRATEG